MGPSSLSLWCQQRPGNPTDPCLHSTHPCSQKKHPSHPDLSLLPLQGAAKAPDLKETLHDGSSGFVSFKKTNQLKMLSM